MQKKFYVPSPTAHRLAIVTGGRKAYQLEKLEKAGLEPSIFCKINVAEDCQKKPSYEALAEEFLIGSTRAASPWATGFRWIWHRPMS